MHSDEPPFSISPQQYELPCASRSDEVARLGGGTCPVQLQRENFDIYQLKVAPCQKKYIHDWGRCPFAHPGERAKRRDPCVYNYASIACTSMKQEGLCALGDACPFAHSAFEYWLHPTRYHTALCKQGISCRRKICFFAHHPSELRNPELARLPAGIAAAALLADARPQKVANEGGSHMQGSSALFKSTDSIDWIMGPGGVGLSSTGAPPTAEASRGAFSASAAAAGARSNPQMQSGAPRLLPNMMSAPAMPSLDSHSSPISRQTAPPQLVIHTGLPVTGPQPPQDEDARMVIQTVADQLLLGKLNVEQATSVLGRLLPATQVLPQLLQLVQTQGAQMKVPSGPTSGLSALPGSVEHGIQNMQPGHWQPLGGTCWAGQLEPAAEDAAARTNVGHPLHTFQ